MSVTICAYKMLSLQKCASFTCYFTITFCQAGVMVNYMHKIIVVTCEEDLQLQRLMEQRRLSEKESKLMIGAQMSLERKERLAQFVIENSGGLKVSTQN